MRCSLRVKDWIWDLSSSGSKLDICLEAGRIFSPVYHKYHKYEAFKNNTTSPCRTFLTIFKGYSSWYFAGGWSAPCSQQLFLFKAKSTSLYPLDYTVSCHLYICSSWLISATVSVSSISKLGVCPFLQACNITAAIECTSSPWCTINN